MLKGAVLYAKRLDDLVRFYSALGGEIVDGADGEFAAVKNSDAELIILQAPDPIASQIVIENPPVARSQTPLKPIVSVPSLEDAIKAADEHGGSLLAGAKQWKFRNYLVQDIVDPEGNIVQLWEAT